MAFDFPASPTVGQVYQGYTWDGEKWLLTTATTGVADATNSGRLTFVNTTTLQFKPYNGDAIKINGSIMRIPSAGIAGLGAPTSIFLNGVAAQTLTINTTYFVYAFSNAGTITADFSTTSHSPSATAGNVGTEIKTGDDTRSLIGMIRIGAGISYANSSQQRFAISWFNRRSIALVGAFTATRTTAGTTFVELNAEIRNEFVTWGEEAVSVAISGQFYNDTLNGLAHTSIGFDGATPEEFSVGMQTPSAGGFPEALGGGLFKNGLAEGYHYCTILGRCSGGGTSNWYGSATVGFLRNTLSTLIRG